MECERERKLEMEGDYVILLTNCSLEWGETKSEKRVGRDLMKCLLPWLVAEPKDHGHNGLGKET